MEASALSADSHFKTCYLSMMLSWLMNSQDHTAFADYGCHCKLADVAERKPFVGYTKSASGSKDEIDWFCAQHTTCHQCLATQMSDCNPKTTPYRFELGYRGDDRVIRCVGVEHDDDQCQENLCQCDRRLAMALARRVNNVKESNKQLDRETQCTINDKQEQFTSCCVNQHMKTTAAMDPFQPAASTYDNPIVWIFK